MNEKFNYYDLIKNRRSIRAYDVNRKVEDAVLGRILHAGILAPTAKNLQPGRFILVTDEAKLKEVGQCYGRDWLKDAPAVLIVVGNKKKAWVREDGFNSLQIDLTIMLDHMILAAEYEGVATCWIAKFDDKMLKEVLNIDEDDFICCITPLGYPPADYEKKQVAERKSFKDMVEVIGNNIFG